MSHLAQRKFVELVSISMNFYFKDCKVLEIGSLDISGSVRDYFRNCEYIGIDVAEGKNVDVVCQAQNYGAPDDSFNHVICCEVMEHNPHWVETFDNMVRMTKPGGLVLMTCATTGRKEHGTTRTQPDYSPLTVELGWNYYKNLKATDFFKKIDIGSLFSKYKFWVNWNSFDLYFCGIKKDTNNPYAEEWDVMVKVMDDYIHSQNKLKICSYRKFIANYLGDSWFIFMRKINSKLKLEILSYANGD